MWGRALARRIADMLWKNQHHRRFTGLKPTPLYTSFVFRAGRRRRSNSLGVKRREAARNPRIEKQEEDKPRQGRRTFILFICNILYAVRRPSGLAFPPPLYPGLRATLWRFTPGYCCFGASGAKKQQVTYL